MTGDPHNAELVAHQSRAGALIRRDATTAEEVGQWGRLAGHPQRIESITFHGRANEQRRAQTVEVDQLVAWHVRLDRRHDAPSSPGHVRGARQIEVDWLSRREIADTSLCDGQAVQDEDEVLSRNSDASANDGRGKPGPFRESGQPPPPPR
jgi:hypothetical protein